MKAKAKTFFLASRLLPRSTREDVEVLYAYFRSVDDLVDEPGTVGVHDVLGTIERDLYAKNPELPLMYAVRSVIDRYAIPARLLAEVIQGARGDLAHSTPETFDDLYAYADLVAGSVGAALCYVLGHVSPESLLAARYLGVAMQLTNILRDVGEDLRQGRIYIPTADMAQCGYSETDLKNRVVDLRFKSVMRLEIYRSHQFYCAGLKGTRFLNPRARPSIVLAAQLYSRILVKIERSGFDVFEKRAAVPDYEKLLLLPSVIAMGHHFAPKSLGVGDGQLSSLAAVANSPADDSESLRFAQIAATPVSSP